MNSYICIPCQSCTFSCVWPKCLFPLPMDFSCNCVCSLALSNLISPWILLPWYSLHTIVWLYHGRALLLVEHCSPCLLFIKVRLKRVTEMWEYNPIREYYYLESVYLFQICKGIYFVCIWLKTWTIIFQRRLSCTSVPDAISTCDVTEV